VVPGCGDDDDADDTATPSKCGEVCDLQEAGGCSLFTAADCKQLCPLWAQVSKECASAEAALSKCRVDTDTACGPGADDPCADKQSKFEMECATAS
jgi:hypothetical protein